MTPQLYIKLAQQIDRQTPEAEALETLAAGMQPGIDSAQAWTDSCQASVDAAQAALKEAQVVEDADVTAQQDALDAANANLDMAKGDLAKTKAAQDEVKSKLQQLRAAIASCQSLIDSSGITMTELEMGAAILEEHRSRIWEQIKAFRDARKEQGVLAGGKWFHSDTVSRIQQLGLVMMGANIPANLQWKTMDGSFITMTPQLAGAIFQATAASDVAMHAAAELHKAGMYSTANPQSYDWKVGWPAVYS